MIPGEGELPGDSSGCFVILRDPASCSQRLRMFIKWAFNRLWGVKKTIPYFTILAQLYIHWSEFWKKNFVEKIMCYNYVLIVLYLTILDLHLRFFSFTNDIAILFCLPLYQIQIQFEL